MAEGWRLNEAAEDPNEKGSSVEESPKLTMGDIHEAAGGKEAYDKLVAFVGGELEASDPAAIRRRFLDKVQEDGDSIVEDEDYDVIASAAFGLKKFTNE